MGFSFVDLFLTALFWHSLPGFIFACSFLLAHLVLAQPLCNILGASWFISIFAGCPLSLAHLLWPFFGSSFQVHPLFLHHLFCIMYCASSILPYLFRLSDSPNIYLQIFFRLSFLTHFFWFIVYVSPFVVQLGWLNLWPSSFPSLFSGSALRVQLSRSRFLNNPSGSSLLLVIFYFLALCCGLLTSFLPLLVCSSVSSSILTHGFCLPYCSE